MKTQKRKKNQKEVANNALDDSTVTVEQEMPSAEAVAAERAREAACERQLAELRAGRGECSDSCSSSDGEATLRGEMRALPPPAPPAPSAPPAAALLLALAAALRPHHDVRFLDDYRQLLAARDPTDAQAATDELMVAIEDAMLAEGGACAGEGGGVVLAGWLGAACAWAEPRVPAAPRALHCLLQHLTPPQVSEVAAALQAALRACDLLAVSDAVRGGRGGRLAAALLRATLGALLPGEGATREEAGAPSVAELQRALAGGWGALDAGARLTALALAGRVMADDPVAARALLAALAPPSPRDTHDSDYLKVSVAVKTLQNLVKDM